MSVSQISLMNWRTVVEPNLTKRETQVLEAIEELAPATAEMVASHLGVPEHTISGRFSGLKKKQKIIKVSIGRNSKGNHVAFYAPANNKADEYGRPE